MSLECDPHSKRYAQSTLGTRGRRQHNLDGGKKVRRNFVSVIPGLRSLNTRSINIIKCWMGRKMSWLESGEEKIKQPKKSGAKKGLIKGHCEKKKRSL